MAKQKKKTNGTKGVQTGEETTVTLKAPASGPSLAGSRAFPRRWLGGFIGLSPPGQ